MMSLQISATRPLTAARQQTRLTRPRRTVQIVRAEGPLDNFTNRTAEEPDRSDTRNIEAGNLSRENAEKRADVGNTRQPELAEAWAFDGPLPETVNSRLAMLGTLAALGAELATGEGVQQQVAKAPVAIAATFLLIIVASVVPVLRGYTRKEPYANGVWTPKAENWNGRLAAIAFPLILLTEAITGKAALANFLPWLN